MDTFEQYCLAEMARPAKSFVDIDLNQAYANSLKKFKALGVHNANTYTIWDFIFRLLPDFFKQPQFTEARKKASGTKQRQFVLALFNNFMHEIDATQLAKDMNDVSKIQAYINRPITGHRRQGKINSQNSSLNKMGLNPLSNDLA